MIIIGGTNLKADKLPLNDVVQYQVESNEALLDIKLKTSARNTACIGVYLHTSLEGSFKLPDVVQEKITYFATDKELLNLLDNGGVAVPATPEPIVIKEKEDVNIDKKIKKESKIVFDEVSATSNVSKGGFELEDIGEVEDELFSLPSLSESTSAGNAKIDQLEGIVKQLRAQLAEAATSYNDLCDMQEVQLLEAKEKYDRMVRENHEALEEIRRRAEESRIPDSKRAFLKYSTYAEKPRSQLQEGFSKEDTKALSAKCGKVHVLVGGAGEGTYRMLKEARKLIKDRPNTLVVDFTGNIYYSQVFKLNPTHSSLALGSDVAVHQLVAKSEGVDFIMTKAHNDIALLQLDWALILNKLVDFAKGRNIVLLFGSVESFPVAYTVSKISTVTKSCSIFTYALAPVLNQTVATSAFIPNGRFKLVVLDYISEFEDFLNKIGDKYEVYATGKNVKWEKIGFEF